MHYLCAELQLTDLSCTAPLQHVFVTVRQQYISPFRDWLLPRYADTLLHPKHNHSLITKTALVLIFFIHQSDSEWRQTDNNTISTGTACVSFQTL